MLDFVESLKACTIEYTTYHFTYNTYRTVNKSNWSQKMVVPTDYDGTVTTRQDFINDLADHLQLYFPHKFNHHWQHFALDMKDESLEPSELAGVADFIEAYHHGAKTNTVCEKEVKTRMLALCFQHGGRRVSPQHASKRRR